MAPATLQQRSSVPGDDRGSDERGMFESRRSRGSGVAGGHRWERRGGMRGEDQAALDAQGEAGAETNRSSSKQRCAESAAQTNPAKRV
jgi:hypothetical protein